MSKPGVEAHCTWGDGPDVLVDVRRENASGHPWLAYADANPNYAGSFGLTTAEVRAFAAQLLVAADRADKLARAYDLMMQEGVP